ncbi:type VI secretion protein TagU [Pseudomonas fluorescens]|jgi:hypothetical protein|uniref:Type VI secretion protein TagU n=1 Tax=Pseudomonas shahriarae TaxID=2745512 RepID=A0ABT5NF60_9PSED|nr:MULTISPECIES: type VI secretion protein TagU [Pseudomonas]AYG08337.1 type VI secretion protein TagU [Pseudomonas fluorescens]MCM8559561.1 type VI secretion protein TagU [Pseudomonas shahriarae]MCU0209227.1 type VI secretion protein TagU [Pseudomonas shahriarae]MDD0979326.1 type VI secretion protein TagU [Pseudomonas shahriarae]MDD0986063.1 type VI secretion protein TagU [Pseudomonas shahriarae]
MIVSRWQVLVLVLLMLVLSGCTANYVFDDDEYRPLGDPRPDQYPQ